MHTSRRLQCAELGGTDNLVAILRVHNGIGLKFPWMSQTTLCPITVEKVLSYIQIPPWLLDTSGEAIVLSILFKTYCQLKAGSKMVVKIPLWFKLATSWYKVSLAVSKLKRCGTCSWSLMWRYRLCDLWRVAIFVRSFCWWEFTRILETVLSWVTLNVMVWLFTYQEIFDTTLYPM